MSLGTTRKVDNPKRGCGHLKEDALYFRGLPFSEDGVLPAFCEFKQPILYREKHFRSWKHINGLQFELAYHPEVVLRPDYEAKLNENMRKAVLLEGVWENELGRHLTRLDGGRARDVINNPNLSLRFNFAALEAVTSQDILMWIGEKYYPRPEDFIDECFRFGISKRIPKHENGQFPAIWSGKTKIYLVHPCAISLGDNKFLPGVIGYSYLHEIIYTSRFEVADPEWIKNLEAQGKVNIVEIGPEGNGNGCNIEDFDKGDTHD